MIIERDGWMIVDQASCANSISFWNETAVDLFVLVSCGVYATATAVVLLY